MGDRASTCRSRCRWEKVSRRLVVHVLGFGLLLIVLNVVIPMDASLGTDDGAYGGQVHALRNGGWTLDRPLPVVAADNEGWSNAAITDAGPLPYTTNPVYALALAAAADVGAGAAKQLGDDPASVGRWTTGALQAIPVVGIVLAAVAAWLIAAELRPSSEPLAFWLVAVGPLLVTSTGLWAHTIAAAAAGFAVLGVIRYLRSGAVRWLALATGSIGLLALLRTESALWIAALCVVALIVDRSVRTTVVGAVGGGVGALAWVANRAWGLSLRADRLAIVTDGRADGGNDGWLASRLPAGWELLATTVRPGPGPVALLAAAVLVATAAVVLRSGDGRLDDQAVRFRSVVTVLLVLASMLYAVVIATAPGQLLAGLVPAWPLLFLLLALGWTTTRAPGRRADGKAVVLLLGSATLFTGLVVLTQYGNSGGLQWGGRYLALAYVPAAAVAAVVGVDSFRRHRWPMLALLVAPTLAGLVASHRLHTTHHEVVDAVVAAPAEVVVTDVRPLPRLAWTALPTAFYVADSSDIVGLFEQLDRAGVKTVTVYGIGSVDVDGLSGYRLVGESDRIRRLTKS